jgi:voltage-gated potassium channel
MFNIFKQIKIAVEGDSYNQKKGVARWKAQLHEIIFESDTFEGKSFDIMLFFFIALSTVIIMLESVHSINASIGFWLYILDWWVTISFTVEYILRIASVKPKKYIFSLYGIIDLMAILPTYLSIFFIQSHYLAVIRILRLLRIFRVLRLVDYIDESNVLLLSLKNSRPKIFVFLYFIFIITLILGAFMYVIEGKQPNSAFTSIPQSIYWAIVTLTTVGYGDIAPVTVLGKIVASGIMVLGYSIISVPAGLVTVEYRKNKQALTLQVCHYCMAENHESDALYCKHCGHLLNDPPEKKEDKQADFEGKTYE